MQVLTSSVATLAALPEAAQAMFAPPGAGSLFATRAWFECVVAAGLPAGGEPRFVCLESQARVLAVIPMLLGNAGRHVSSLTTPYTCLYRPLFADGLASADLTELGAAFGRFCRHWPTVRLDAMPSDDADLSAFLAGTGNGGIGRAGFVHFANWHEPVGGIAWPDYLRARPGGLRETIRRKLARAGREPGVRFQILRDPNEAADAIATYEAVYARSWKAAEPYPAFNATLIARAAETRMLRLGVLRVADRAVAVQLWVVTGGVATVLKLAHDEEARALSPGTVLTAMMVRHLLEVEHVDILDFGRGDDAYKQGWVARRRERIGVVLFNPLRAAGLTFAARHVAGVLTRRFRAG